MVRGWFWYLRIEGGGEGIGGLRGFWDFAKGYGSFLFLCGILLFRWLGGCDIGFYLFFCIGGIGGREGTTGFK